MRFFALALWIVSLALLVGFVLTHDADGQESDTEAQPITLDAIVAERLRRPNELLRTVFRVRHCAGG